MGVGLGTVLHLPVVIPTLKSPTFDFLYFVTISFLDLHHEFNEPFNSLLLAIIFGCFRVKMLLPLRGFLDFWPQIELQ